MNAILIIIALVVVFVLINKFNNRGNQIVKGN